MSCFVEVAIAVGPWLQKLAVRSIDTASLLFLFDFTTECTLKFISFLYQKI